jgi:ubiquinone/menaquinone biosynthesis C-methylase UbiE
MVKNTLIDGSEKDVITARIQRHFMKKPLSILDIGTGDGRFLLKIIKKLERLETPTTVTCLDPHPLAKKVFGSFPASQFISNGFEKYDTDASFDIVMAIQSLYYVDDEHRCIDKMIRMTKKGGLTIIVLWSKECTLSKLFRHCTQCGEYLRKKGLITIENIFQYIQTRPNAIDPQLTYFFGRVLLSQWKKDPEILKGACIVYSRTVKRRTIKIHQRHIRILLDHFNDIEQRVNGVIFIQK